MSTFVVGLTGGIASGKTTVSDLFAELGVPVIDADIAAREVVEPGTPGLAQLVEAFGDGILDEQGRLDRRGLRNIVFADPAARRRLEQITHPLIHQRLIEQLQAAAAPYALLVVPLLTRGSALAKLTDRILVVDVPVEVQRARVVARDQCSPEQADAIIAAQSPREERLALADDVIVNDGQIEQLRPQIEDLHRRYLALAAAPQAD